MLRRYPITVIVIAQLFGASLWFSPNAALQDLMRVWGLTTGQLGQLTASVQVGFIAGTLALASSGLADRFAASRIFALSSVFGAAFNGMFAMVPINLHQALILRFLVGVCLAGIYPLGMKMVIGWNRNNAGSTLGILLAMLTIGTALPHAIRAAGGDLDWRIAVLVSSGLALIASLALMVLGDGPYLARSSASPTLRWGAAFNAFRDIRFRASALGYFGHMWELYAFWTIVPFLVVRAMEYSSNGEAASPGLVSLLSFFVIGSGSAGCLIAGKLSVRMGSARVAAIALATSGLMCFVYPFLEGAGISICLVALVVWGMSVVADSAQFSAISAASCSPDAVGSALAIQNSIGFSITILSITVATSSLSSMGAKVAWLLLPGPIIGLVFLSPLWAVRQVQS